MVVEFCLIAKLAKYFRRTYFLLENDRKLLPIYLILGDEKTAVRFKVDIHYPDSGKNACFGFLSAHPQNTVN
jgi:hypothetical protein